MTTDTDLAKLLEDLRQFTVDAVNEEDGLCDDIIVDEARQLQRRIDAYRDASPIPPDPYPHDPLAPRRTYDCLPRLAPGEPYFMLRAQDNLAAGLVEQWAIQSKLSGRCPHEKTHEAYEIADRMRRWGAHKDPD